MISNLISNLQHPNLEFLVVDNSCTFTDSLDRENIKILRPGQNLGFAKAANLAVRQGSGEILVFLNPDVKIELTSILQLASCLESDLNQGIVAPLLEEKQHRGPYINGGFWPTIPRMFMHFSFGARYSHKIGFLKGLYAHQKINSTNGIINLDWVSGACMAVRHSDFESVGGFNERWFMYCEDMELSFQISKSGKIVGISPKSTGQHLGGSSDSRQGSFTVLNTMWITNLVQFYKLFFSCNSLFRLFLWILICILGFGLRWIVLLLYCSKDYKSKIRIKSESTKYFAYVRALFQCLREEFMILKVRT